MKILINSINYAPELVGIGKYTTEMAEWLCEQGHDVTVVTAPPYYPDWMVSKGYSSFLYRTETINGVKVIRCPLWVPAKPSGIKRLVHLASFAFTSFVVMFWKAIRLQPDVVFVVEPPFFCAPAALVASFLGRSTSWIHIQDFEVDAAFNLGLLKSNRLKGWTLAVESWVLRRFDVVSSISLRMIDRLKDKGITEDKIVLFENWAEINVIYPLAEIPSLYHKLDLPENRSIVLYSGNMGEKQGLELIIEAAERLSHREDVFFLLCGAGSSKERLQDASKLLKNIMFLPLQPADRLNELLNIADIHLLPQKSGAEDLVMPSKLTNMMASGKPVVATVAANSQIAKVLLGCGIVVPPENEVAFCDAISRLVDDKELALRYGQRGRRYAEKHWDKDKVLSEMFSREL